MKQQKYTIMFILLFALSGIAVWGISTQKSQKNPVAVIYQNNKEIKRIDLKKVKEPYEFTITNEDGGTNRIRVEPKGISVVEASCPDGVCMRVGIIKNGKLPITCAPNHLVIKIENGTEEVDQLSY